MKKLCMMLAVAACAIGAFAALDTRVASADVAFPAKSVTAGAAVTNAVMAVEPCRGLGEISFAIGSVAAASSNRTITATLIGTNTVAGGWSVINTATYKGAAAAVLRMPVQCDYLPPYIKVAVANTTAASVVAGTLYSYK